MYVELIFRKFSSNCREGNYKLIIGHPGKPDGWISPPEYKQDYPINATDFHFKIGVLLFDLNTDPLEKNDLSHIYPSIVRKLKHKLKYETHFCPKTYFH